MSIQYDPRGLFSIQAISDPPQPIQFGNGEPYTGPVSGIDTELNLSAATVGYHVQALTSETYIVTGDHDDYIDISFIGPQVVGGPEDHSGQPPQRIHNIVDGGGGSNFIVAGIIPSDFYVDGRNPTHNLWSTITNIFYGDGITIWGVKPGDPVTVLENEGAPGATGATLVFGDPGKPAIGITIAGYSTAELANPSIFSSSYGHTADIPGVPGADYFHIDRMGPIGH